jgi:membrane protein required for colicin V production
MGINLVDFAVVGLLLISALIGIARGFTREVLGIGAWVGAFIAALYGLVLVRPLFAPYIKNPFVSDVIAGLLLFIIALFILGSLSRAISYRIKGSVLGGLDRSLGFLFGLVRGAVVLVIGFFIASLIWATDKWPTEIKDAKLYSYGVEGSNWLRNAIPEDAVKNLGLKVMPKVEETVKEKSTDHVVSALSQPKASSSAKEPMDKKPEDAKKEEGYADTQRGDMERLVKNNEKNNEK